MKPKHDPDIHGDQPPLTAEFVAGMRPVRETRGQEWVDRAMKLQHRPAKLDASKEE